MPGRGRGSLPRETGKGTPHVLYRFWDAKGELLYIGITLRLAGRIAAHRIEKEWWSSVSRITIEHHESRPSALEAEAAAIRAERPRWNVIHNSERDDRPATLQSAPWSAEDMLSICTECLWPSDFTAPHSWQDGRALYRCELGHTWWHEFAHGQTGRAA